MEPEVKSVPEAAGEANEVVVVKRPNPLLSAVMWTFVGPQGLRAGWAVTLFAFFVALLGQLVTFALKAAHAPKGTHDFSAINMLTSEGIVLLILTLAVFLVALIEGRHLLDYNFRGSWRPRYFLTGLLVGFATVSLMIAGLYAGGWIHFGPVALSGVAIWTNALTWGLVFIGVGFTEEGAFRGFLLYTFARGLNFWWALGILGTVCGYLLWQGKGNGIWGVYIIAALGLVPCLMLHLRKAPDAGFWMAAWVTSTLFGFVHTGNGGENWIGIFAAAAIGFVFCVTVKLTGSLWWALGFHAAWDWGLTYFYGAADSGNAAVGHFLSTNPVGNELWSGGADGPEGSLLILPLMVLLLAAIVFAFGRKKPAAQDVVMELPAS